MNCTQVVKQELQVLVDKQMLRIGVFVFATVALLLLVSLCRFIKGSRFCSGAFKFIASSTTAIIALMVSYIFGLIYDADFKHELVSIWAVLLVFMYATISWDTLKLTDRSSTGVVIVKFFIYVIYAVIYAVIMFSGTTPSSYIPLSLLLLSSGCKVAESVSVQIFLSCASQNIRLKLNADDDDDDSVDDHDPQDPFLKCKYVVYPGYPKFEGEDPSRAITIKDIWACKEENGCILSSKEDASRQLRNRCLSVALFWKLLYRIVGIPAYESSHPNKAWKLILNGFPLPKNDHTSTCPFDVIQLELRVLSNFLYHHAGFFSYKYGFRWLFANHLVFWLQFGWIANNISGKLKSQHVFVNSELGLHLSNSKQVAHSQMYAYATTVLAAYVIFFDSMQFMYGLLSIWPRMSVICTYLKRESWKKQTIYDFLIKSIVAFVMLWKTEEFVIPKGKSNLAQYTLLESFSSNQHFLPKTASQMAYSLIGTRIARPGRKKGDDTRLTEHIREAVRRSLVKHGPQLSSGIASLEASKLPHEVKSKLSRTGTQFGTDAEVVLTWHIATSICEIKSKPLPEAPGCTDFQVASTLSKYCAYLVAFAPDLLPGNAAITDYICSLVIEDACARLKDCELSYEKLMDIAKQDNGEIEAGRRDKDTILQHGAGLGKLLQEEIREFDKRWKTLANFWAEMILYLAPNDHNVWAHVDKLASGGEFITQLWVLLFHAGIVNRESLRNKTQETSNGTT